MASFQSQVYTQPAPGVAGDFCDHNPRHTVDAGPGGLVAGASGVYVGRFAWATDPADGDGSPAVVNNTGFGQVTGFVHREQGVALITTYLAASSNLVPPGFGITLHSSGGFWAKNDGVTEAQPGMKAFANIADGKVTFAASGTITGGASCVSASIASTTLTLVGAISGQTLTVASVSAGTVYPGAKLSSNAVGVILPYGTIDPNTGVASTGTGTTGTYVLSAGEQTVAAGTTIGGTYGLLTNGTVTGVITVGMVLSGTGVVTSPPTVVTYIASGAGGSGGTSVVTDNTVVNSTTIVGSSTVETKWYARSTGLAGEIVKISSQALG